MAQLTITVPDGVVDRIRAAFADADGNPATLNQLRQYIKEYIQQRVAGYESHIARTNQERIVKEEQW